MRPVTEDIAPSTTLPANRPTKSSPAASWWKGLAELGRGLFWASFGIFGHVLVALVGLLVLALLIVGPILALAGLIELVSLLLG